VFQDMVQKFHHASKETVPLFVQDLRAMVVGRRNHPCILQWLIFNEGDCFHVFIGEERYDINGVYELVQELDPKRVIDVGAGSIVGDVLDIHHYPDPGDKRPGWKGYAMVGEFGGLGRFVLQKQWIPNTCHAYAAFADTSAFEERYREMALFLQDKAGCLGASVYTQLVDVEAECNGFFNYDRSSKFNDTMVQMIRNENLAIIKSHQGPFIQVGLLHLGTLADTVKMNNVLTGSLCFGRR